MQGIPGFRVSLEGRELGPKHGLLEWMIVFS